MPKKIFATSLAFIILVSVNYLFAQESDLKNYYIRFTKYYTSGDFINAEKCLLNSLDLKEPLPSESLIAIYNNLGVINNLLGRYDEALRYFNLAQKEVGTEQQPIPELADIYINTARIYGIVKEFDKSIEYLEQGIKIYLNIKKPSQNIIFNISTAYLNLGLNYYKKKNYKKALEFLEKSKDIKLEYGLSEVALPYLNIAKTYAEINKPDKAQKFFLESIYSFNKEFGQNYYRLAEAYFDYGLFLRSMGKNKEAYEIHQKALAICLKNYGPKHTLVALAYKHLGDHFFNQTDYRTALQYYQKSVIAVVRNFNDTCIYSNPPLDSVIFDIRLLDNLKQKSLALELLSNQQVNLVDKEQTISKSFETIELALTLINRIRSGYISSESQIYLAENEKETYIFAVHIAEQLFKLTNNPEYIQRMYSIASLCKSAVLRNEIVENELLFRKGDKDSLTEKRNKYLINIASYNKLIQDELQKMKPDIEKIGFWKDALFNLNRSKEKVDERIKGLFPQYQSIIQKTEPVSLEEIQDHLKKGETLIEYFLSNHYTKGERELYIFTITHSNLNFKHAYLDSLFLGHVASIKRGTLLGQSADGSLVSYQGYTDALYYMYEKLMKPVEKGLIGKKLIIVPDEEIAYLPFDAFISQIPSLGQSDYDGLHYLIKDYIFSYGYTSSLIFQKEKINTSEVYAFSPDYSSFQKSFGFNALQGTGKEIKSISKWFRCNEYYGSQATESNFKNLLKQPAIFHLAMHSQVDSNNSRYSYLIFDPESDSENDGKLFNYEISMSRVVSPMVVLSACNTGNGNLYHAEGIMSLTRGFILAGASTVINTFWDVNDDASAKIMVSFYQQLSKGEEKDEALRNAKLEYLKTTPPTYTNPYYWAAYEVMGDKSPIKHGVEIYLIYLGLFLALGATSFAVYFKWFRRL